MTDRIITDNNGRKHITNEPLLHPPAAQRQWVGLTDDERVDLWKATETDNRMVLIDSIEAKLKEKNGM